MKFRYAGIVAMLSMLSLNACAAGTDKSAEKATGTVKSAVVAEVKKVDAAPEKVMPEKIVLATAETPAVPEAAAAPAVGADGFALPVQKKKSTAPEIPPLGSSKSPLDVAAAAAKGTLKNPYSYTTMNPDLVEAGKRKYMGVSCNGCHGGNGGGGMCPPLSNETWVFGADDDTLFRLIALGSDELMKQGYTRKGRENVVGPMPAQGALVKTEDDMWRIIYFIRGNFRGEAKNIKW
ncbi:MAG: c-type cytochrome [Methylotenera sp.]|uniref:c-type cytochrome n=2 Tax=Methylotenera sp. TaxID=2051956 RepID=UPI0027265EAD|nr:c-type cytochrome [Methylotenera sp.]MDO9394555.1 c-type cytochrome [Methylotenera sp.]MDP1522408.1 c-type cytochrome [Methylotenera sp.]MDP3819354.1 c-type cytochrome [Methylotenera sp.]